MIGCNETVTFIHHTVRPDADEYTCTAVVGVSWFGKRGISPTQSGETPTDEYTVRIPEDLIPEVLPESGDIAVRGVVASYNGANIPNGLEHFVISKVSDNRRGTFLRHLAVSNK